MDYEKKYKDALEKARKLIGYPTTQPFVSDLEDIFPELAESEDERIRKWCISHFRECFRVSGDNAEYQEFLNNKVIPWFEKQGEQKPIVTPKFRVGDIITDGKDFPRCTIEEIDEQVYYCDYTNIDIVDADKNWKLVEHKPADKVEPKFKVGDWIVSNGCPNCGNSLMRIAVRVAKWQKEQIKKAMDLGEPPYLISVEQAYYRTSKLLEE